MQKKADSAQKNIPPKISGWPLIGVVPHLYQKQLDFLLKAQARHGDVFRLQLGATEVVALAHPDHAQHVLVDNARNYQNKGEQGFRIAPLPLMRGGLATAIQPATAWKQQRRGVQPYLNNKRMPDLTELMIEAITESLSSWDSFADAEQTIDIQQEVTRISLNIIGHSIFGLSIPPEEADKISAEVRIVMDYLWLGTLQNALPGWVPTPGKRRYQQAIRSVDTYIETLIDRALQPAAKTGNLIATLTALVNEGAMSRNQLHNEAITLLIAGYESNAANLGWTFHLLTQHPDIQQRLHSEIAHVLADRNPTFADMPALAYPRLIVQEALRLYAPSYWTQRKAAEDDEIGGLHIPAGSTVVIMIHLVHRHPEIWPQPERFDPERFLPENSTTRHKRAWLPFGAGQRMCMATEFALTQGQLILSQIFQRYQLDAVPDKTPQMLMASNIRPKGGVWVKVRHKTPV